jgi:hypothetical protein
MPEILALGPNHLQAARSAVWRAGMVVFLPFPGSSVLRLAVWITACDPERAAFQGLSSLGPLSEFGAGARAMVDGRARERNGISVRR